MTVACDAPRRGIGGDTGSGLIMSDRGKSPESLVFLSAPSTEGGHETGWADRFRYMGEQPTPAVKGAWQMTGFHLSAAGISVRRSRVCGPIRSCASSSQVVVSCGDRHHGRQARGGCRWKAYPKFLYE